MEARRGAGIAAREGQDRDEDDHPGVDRARRLRQRRALPSPSPEGRPPAALWAHSISGDLPNVLVRIDEPEDLGIVRQLLRAHEYWRLKRLAVDLVILNERAPSYLQDLQNARGPE